MTYKIAVGSSDGITIDQHFGSGTSFYIYEISQESDETLVTEHRVFEGGGDCGTHDHNNIAGKIDALADCQLVLVAKIGGKAEKQLTLKHIVPLAFEGSIETALERVQKAYKRRVFAS
jgi:predicted Fe-Mo cluster-binding NifX family protein